MKRTRILNLIALFINLAIVGAFCAGFYFKFLQAGMKDFDVILKAIGNECRYFEFIAACVTMLASLFMIFVNIVNMNRMKDSTPRWIYTIRYISMGMSILIICTTLLASGFNSGLIKDPSIYIDYKSHQFYWCTVMCILSVVLFIFFELEPKCPFKQNFGPLIAWVGYCTAIVVYMIILIPKKGIAYVANDFCPYFIFLITKDLINAQTIYNINQTITISILAITVVLSFALPILLRLLNRLMSNIIIGYEYVEIDGVNNNIAKPINKSKEVKRTVKTKGKTKKKIVHNESVYFVSVDNRKLRTWKVSMPDKSTKVFNTQQEALAYASYYAKKSKGSVRVRSALGKLKFEG